MHILWILLEAFLVIWVFSFCIVFSLFFLLEKSFEEAFFLFSRFFRILSLLRINLFSFLGLLQRPEAQSARSHAVLRDVSGRQALIFEHWKYIDDSLPAGESVAGADGRMLFDLASDPGERLNVIEDYPEVADRARRALEHIRNGSDP